MTFETRDVAGTIGAVILMLTAAFHATGFVKVAQIASSGEISGLLSMALPALWLLPSIHWAAFAIAAIAAIRNRGRLARWLLLAIAALVAIDGASLLLHVGPFAGAWMLLGAASFLIASALAGQWHRDH